MTINNLSFKKLKTDALLLQQQIIEYSNDNKQTYLPSNMEFTRCWELYNEIRISLINLNKELFSSLRDIPQPKPDMNMSTYYPDGFYSSHDLKPLRNELEKSIKYIIEYENEYIVKSDNYDIDSILIMLTKKFHRVVRELRSRYDNRETLNVEDEYDMQDLFRSLLSLYFEDIRSEEWSPSYAGGSSRIDFLLKKEKTVIELKKTRKNLNANELGKQLIIDIDKYKVHPDCENIFCFVYDPDGWIANPKGIEIDLSKAHDKVNVKVIIEPK
jgi:hypothetical protein